MNTGWYRAGGVNRYYRAEDGTWSVDRQDGHGVVPYNHDTPEEMDAFAETGRLVPEKDGPPPDLVVFGTGIMPDTPCEGVPGYQHQGGNG